MLLRVITQVITLNNKYYFLLVEQTYYMKYNSYFYLIESISIFISKSYINFILSDSKLFFNSFKINIYL